MSALTQIVSWSSSANCSGKSLTKSYTPGGYRPSTSKSTSILLRVAWLYGQIFPCASRTSASAFDYSRA